MSKGIKENTTWGFKQLNPLPTSEEINRFYNNEYYNCIKTDTRRASELRKLMKGDLDSERERHWLTSVLYSDILTILNAENKDKEINQRLLDVGCGPGEFLGFMKNNGWNVSGLEPSKDASNIAFGKGLDIYCLTIEKFIKQYEENKFSFDVIILLNVLEHVLNPVSLMQNIKDLILPDGIIVIRVPNDFSNLQLYAQKYLNTDKYMFPVNDWWVSRPDHINYFTVEELKNFIIKLGLKPFYIQTDYPMEMFIFTGKNYLYYRKLGDKCHFERVNFELKIPPHIRRLMYEAFAKIGIGRNTLLFCKGV